MAASNSTMLRPRRSKPGQYTEGSNEECMYSSESDSAFGSDSSSDESKSFTVPLPITKSEIHRTRAQIAQQCHTLSDLHAKYADHKRICDEIEAEIQLAQQCLFETKAIIAPITRMPLEVLGLMFTVHVGENEQSPWSLMHICRTWRAAALVTRSIWSRILLVPSDWRKSKTGKQHMRICDGREVCFKKPQLLRALKRAGATPLDLAIGFTKFKDPWKTYASDQRSDTVELLALILEHHVNLKLRSLTIMTHYHSPILEEMLYIFDFTNLVSLSLDGCYTSVITNVVQETQGLRTLDIHGSLLGQMASYSRWEVLEELVVNGIHDSFANRSIIRKALSIPTALVSVNLYQGTVSEPGDHPIHIPTLKRLKLDYIRDLWPIDCPNLTHLTFIPPDYPVTLPDKSVHLPQLVEFIYITSNNRNDPLRVFVFPPLEKFEFQIKYEKYDYTTILKSLWPFSASKGIITGTPSTIEPRKLILRKVQVAQKVLAGVLAGRKLLTELVTTDIEVSVEFFNTLLRVVKEADNGTTIKETIEIPCPNLKRLELDLVMKKKIKDDQVVVEKIAKAWIKARGKAGAPIERLAMRFTEGEGWKDLVNA